MNSIRKIRLYSGDSISRKYQALLRRACSLMYIELRKPKRQRIWLRCNIDDDALAFPQPHIEYSITVYSGAGERHLAGACIGFIAYDISFYR